MTNRSPLGRWPVSFRPQRGEVLYSWLARCASVYGLSPAELLPERSQPFRRISLLVQQTSPEILKDLAISTGLSVPALAKRTLAGAYPTGPSSWWIGHPAGETGFDRMQDAPLQFCPRCLADGVPFLRLRWQWATMTICRKHAAPLQWACTHCHRICWPLCERTASARFHFYCGHCGHSQDRGGRLFEEKATRAVRLLIRFENQILRALTQGSVEASWIGHATSQEFLHLVDDLLWAITCQSYHSRPVYKLQTPPFPLGTPYLPAAVTKHWRFAAPHVRRSLLATILAIFASSKSRACLQARSRYRYRWHDLLACLSSDHSATLERRSWDWPAAAHNALRHAAQLSRDQRFFRPRETRSCLPISEKHSCEIDKVY